MLIYSLTLLLVGQAPAGQFKSRPLVPLTPLQLPASAVHVDLNAGLQLPSIKPSITAAAAPVFADGLSVQAARITSAVAADPSGLAAKSGIDALYFGNHGRTGGAASSAHSGGDAALNAFFIINDEGVSINGRAASYYREVRRLVDKFKGKLDLRDSLDVMDDTYADVWAKLATIEGIARARGIDRQNTHLEETLFWVDGVMKDGSGRTIAVHTHQVYYHHADNPQSEIAEGIRRVDHYLRDAERHFSRGGKAERKLGRLHEVHLVFNTGYDEIKQHLRMREAALNKRYPGRYRFAFIKVPTKEEIRAQLNALIKKYNGKGMLKIFEGVTYSRYVGMLLELKTIEHYSDRGYDVVQSGRDMFDADGHYYTELDVVLRHRKSGRLIVVESKSARVPLPFEEVLRDKVVYKLDTYLKHRPRMESEIGGPFDVVFAFDVGNNEGLRAFLKSKEKELSAKYGFKISFIFLSSIPEQGLGAAVSPASSGWKHLSSDSLEVLRALRQAPTGALLGEQIIAATGLGAEQVFAALKEIAVYPLGPLASTSSDQTLESVGWTHTVLLPRAAEKVDLFLNKAARELSQEGLTVLRVLDHYGPSAGRVLLSRTGLEKAALGRALIELRDGGLSLVELSGDGRKASEGAAVVSIRAQAAALVETLLKNRD